MELFSWGKVILLVLQLVNRWMDYAEKKGYIKQGYDEAIAAETRAIFVKTSHAKKIMEDVNAMSNSEVDAALVALEPSDSSASDTSSGPIPLSPGGNPPGTVGG